MGPWTSTDSPPADLVKTLPAPEESEQGGPSSPPSIVTADKPTELISTQGKPEWQSLPGRAAPVRAEHGNALAARSRRRTICMSCCRAGGTGRSHLGRALDLRPFRPAPGGVRRTFRRHRKSAGCGPRSLARLKPKTPCSTCRCRRRRRSSATRPSSTWSIDGVAEIREGPGTSVSYAVNSAAQVLEIAGRYYAVDNGVWFMSLSATNGPWSVADSIPEEEIQQIPAQLARLQHRRMCMSTNRRRRSSTSATHPGTCGRSRITESRCTATGWYYLPYLRERVLPKATDLGLQRGIQPLDGLELWAELDSTASSVSA